jgi:hypothetical protein
VVFFHTVPPATTWVRWVNDDAFHFHLADSTLPTFARPVHAVEFLDRLRRGSSAQALRRLGAVVAAEHCSAT